jgi:hypothetical protein
MKAKVGTGTLWDEYYVHVNCMYVGKDLNLYDHIDSTSNVYGKVYFETKEEAQALADRYNKTKSEPVEREEIYFFDKYGHTTYDNSDYFVRIKFIDGEVQPIATVEKS